MCFAVQRRLWPGGTALRILGHELHVAEPKLKDIDAFVGYDASVSQARMLEPIRRAETGFLPGETHVTFEFARLQSCVRRRRDCHEVKPMTVYVDDMYRYPMGRRGMAKLSHMIGDTELELHAMAELIGVARRQYQAEHYDIAMTKRALAISAGAVEVTLRQLACMNHRRKVTGCLGAPTDAEAWLHEWWRSNIAIRMCSRQRAASLRY